MADPLPDSAPDPVKPTRAAEDYLERILSLIQTKGEARVVDLAAELGISLASVTAMAQRLDASGHLVYRRYRSLNLTPQGEAVARGVARRHELLTGFLRELDLPEAIIARDVEGLEHHLSDETCEALARLTEQLRSTRARCH
jgi:Mn-dependent DtxR family transcriptional regulator